jgi:8-oxo-dGTP diphosphatase
MARHLGEPRSLSGAMATRSPDSGAGWGRHRVQPWSELDDWDRMTLATDVVLMTVKDGDLWVLLYKRGDPPYPNRWALPGVFVQYPESAEQAAHRALRDKARLHFTGRLDRLDWSWEPGRDPRGWVGCVTLLALLPAASIHPSTGVTLARVHVPWPGETGGPVSIEVDGKPVKLAFTHADIVAASVKRLRGRLRWTDTALDLMPPTFTLSALQQAYEAVLGEPLNRVTFRKLVRDTLNLVEPTGELQPEVNHRPAELFRRRTST